VQVHNLTDQGLREYLVTFHSSLDELASRYLPPDMRRKLTHTARLPSRVVGYISTQFGLAIDYDPPERRTGSEQTSYDILRGSERIEDLVLIGAPKRMLDSHPVIVIDGTPYWFTGINFVGPFRLGNEGATVVFDRCTFSWGDRNAGGWAMGTCLLEVYGNRRSDHWTRDKAVIRAQEEVLSGLFELHRAQQKGVSLSEYYARHRDRAVLVLGSYSAEGLVRLKRIAGALTDIGYDPVLLSDVPDQEAQTLSQKMVMVGSLSRFVVIDDTEKSGHLNELELCKINGWLTVILRAAGYGSSAMTAGASVLSNVILETRYDPTELDASMATAVAWLEGKRKEVGRRLSDVYPWAQKSD
jgi:hypothetical protein